MILPQEPPRWTRVRFVRCGNCGAKALVACSQCPQCEHPLGLRDSFGEPLPLFYCATCDLYVPRKYAHCPWCGTKQPTFRKAHAVWTAAAIVAGIGVTWAVWDANTTHVAAPMARASVATTPESTIVFPAEVDPNTGSVARATADSSSLLAVAPDSTATADSASKASDSSSIPALPVPAPAAPRVTRAAPVTTHAAPVPKPARVATATPRTSSPLRAPAGIASARQSPKAAGTPPRGTRIRWVGTTVRGWITVRMSADKRSRVIASLGPDTRVQLGEWRGGWVHVRSRGIAGWVDGSRPLSIGIASTSGARGLTR